MSQKHAEISKFMSFVLRHRPDAIGITLDTEGWASISELIAAAVNEGRKIDHQLIQTVVATSEKKRFAISDTGTHIRAVQGHSANCVDIAYIDRTPPEVLYHGTAARFIESIRHHGLVPGSRRHVHLSQDEKTAMSVGQRHGKPIVLKIKALIMQEQGAEFFQAD